MIKRRGWEKMIVVLAGIFVIGLAAPCLERMMFPGGNSGLVFAAAERIKDGTERYNWDTKKYQYYEGAAKKWVDYEDDQQGPAPKKRGKFDIGEEQGAQGAKEGKEEGGGEAKKGPEMSQLGRINIFEIFKKSFTLVILLLCSFLALACAIERYLYYKKAILKDSAGFMLQLQQLCADNEFDKALDLCVRTEGALPRVMKAGLANRAKPKNVIIGLMTSAQIYERILMEKLIGIVGTLGNSCPFIGLFGTVVGIIKAFKDLAASGEGGPSVVAAGIAEALVATAGGLLVAIPCVMVFNYFTKKVKVAVNEIDASTKQLLVFMGKE